uniref:ATP synthase F0 subunit 8 n=1 Tax=Panagrolaimus sp. PS1159 TaxID=55785 RepID=A0AC35EXI0_9BILA
MLYSFLDPINLATIAWLGIYVIFLGLFFSAGVIIMTVYLKLNPLKPINEDIPESLMERATMTSSPTPCTTSTVHPIVKV